jgi:hypothetical protein
MSDQLGQDVPSETAQVWDSVRRVREPIAWTFLVLTAIWVLISVWELFGLPGAPVPSPFPVTTFAIRASVVAPQFVALGIVALPVVSVILVAFAGGLTDHARQVVQTAISILAVALGLGVLSWLGALHAHTPAPVASSAPVAVPAPVSSPVPVSSPAPVAGPAPAGGSPLRPGIWFIADAADLAVAATALVFTVAVIRSRELRSLTSQLGDFGEDDEARR